MLWGRVVQSLARYEERGDAFPGHDVRCWMESFFCVLVVSVARLLNRCNVRTRRRRRVVRARCYVYERSSVFATRIAPLMSAVLLASIHAKTGLGRTCDASAAGYPLIRGHRLGIKLDLRQAQTWRSLSACLWSRANYVS